MSTLLSTDMHINRASTRVHAPPGGQSSVAFGYDAPERTKPKTNHDSPAKPVSLAQYASSGSSAIATNVASKSSSASTPVPLSAFSFGNMAVKHHSHPSNSSFSFSDESSSTAVNRRGSIQQGHPSNSSINLGHGPMTQAERDKDSVRHTARKEVAPVATPASTPQRGQKSFKRANESHISFGDSGLVSTEASETVGRNHHHAAPVDHVGGVLSNQSDATEAPKHYHRHLTTGDTHMTAVGGSFSHSGEEQSVMSRMHNIHSGESQIGDMLGGHSTIAPEQSKHVHHRAAHNSTESHMGTWALGGTHEDALTIAPSRKHHQITRTRATESSMGFCLDQASDVQPAMTPRNTGNRSSSSMTSIMSGDPTPESVHRTGKHLVSTPSRAQNGGMSDVLKNVGGQRPASASREAPQQQPPPLSARALRNNSSSIVFG